MDRVTVVDEIKELVFLLFSRSSKSGPNYPSDPMTKTKTLSIWAKTRILTLRLKMIKIPNRR